MAKQYKATLVRGNTYTHMQSKTTFKNGEARTIGEDLKVYLEAHAVDNLTVAAGSSRSNGENVTKPKFKFVEIKQGAETTEHEDSAAQVQKPAGRRSSGK